MEAGRVYEVSVMESDLCASIQAGVTKRLREDLKILHALNTWPGVFIHLVEVTHPCHDLGRNDPQHQRQMLRQCLWLRVDFRLVELRESISGVPNRAEDTTWLQYFITNFSLQIFLLFSIDGNL